MPNNGLKNGFIGGYFSASVLLELSFLLLCLLSLLPLLCFAHGSAEMHYDDFTGIFNGYGDDSFQELARRINSGIDAYSYVLEIKDSTGKVIKTVHKKGLPGLFKERLGSLPGNHRILGHGWALNDDIPKQTLDYLSRFYPGRKKEIIDVWRTFVDEINHEAVRLTGLPAKQANAYASLLYNIHLLGDLEPDNKLTDLVLPRERIAWNIERDVEILFKNDPNYIAYVKKRIASAMKRGGSDPKAAAEALMRELYSLRMGTKHNAIWGKSFKPKYSIERAVAANTKNAMRKMRGTIPISPNNEYLAQQFSHMMTPGHILHNINKIQVVKGILREIDKNGRKALILELPFQFSVEQRAASTAAKKMILARGYEKLSPEFLESVKGIAKTAALSASKKTGGSLSITEAETIADKAVAWARISPKNAALKDGVITFVISEGFTLYRYYESDLTEKELMFETAKNATLAFVLGSATYCLVALGATPGGLIVIGVGIGLTMITDFAFTQMKEEFFDPGFSLDDIIGGISANIRLRRSIWELGLDQKSLFNINDYGTSILEPVYKNDGIHNIPTHSGNLFDIHENHTSIFDSKK